MLHPRTGHRRGGGGRERDHAETWRPAPGAHRRARGREGALSGVCAHATPGSKPLPRRAHTEKAQTGPLKRGRRQRRDQVRATVFPLPHPAPGWGGPGSHFAAQGCAASRKESARRLEGPVPAPMPRAHVTRPAPCRLEPDAAAPLAADGYRLWRDGGLTPDPHPSAPASQACVSEEPRARLGLLAPRGPDWRLPLGAGWHRLSPQGPPQGWGPSSETRSRMHEHRVSAGSSGCHLTLPPVSQGVPDSMSAGNFLVTGVRGERINKG